MTTLSAMAFDFWLISAMPQGLHLTKDIIVSIVVGLVLTVAGLFFRAKNKMSFSAAAFAFANIFLLSQVNLIAHLAPSYVGRYYPLVDQTLARIDSTFGFDWIQYFEWHVNHPLFGMTCRIAYLCWPSYALFIIVVLAAYQRISSMARFLIASTVSLTIVYVVAIVTPSYGAYFQHGMTASQHPNFWVQFSNYKDTYDALRAGVVDIYAAEIPSGTISFPSFHTTTVVLYLWAAWSTPARWITLAVQTLCFLTIPVQGAHFLTDMIAGGAIGVGAIMFSGTVVREDINAKISVLETGDGSVRCQIG
ncbi:hypothetical protein TSA1_05005 [Bradyrhizobium nitroreducens]|uniref:Inositolphosphotransferase Aur1/Ipt1 domain-containing protein n=1 Tax=Bradyrhizobium nitroreducens TaxID=709803 RepID=A0A2M6U6I0_9BRAD|nr:hypothetical protein TSA1_05005 [Bradyrhizobium nitroreducens]